MSNETLTTETTEANNHHCFTPRVDIWENSEALCLQLEMPGVAQDQVDIRLEDQVLTVLGRVAPNEFGEQVHAEYAVGNFERAFRISERVNSDAIQAGITNGILSLTLPKAEAAKPKRIAVTVG
jgi:HSP20 family molecular chaperone IbpA